MDATENQNVNREVLRTDAVECRNHAGKYRTDAAEFRTSAESTTVIINNIHLAQINLQKIEIRENASYHNGHFIPVFQDAIQALACNPNVKPGTHRVLLYLLGIVDDNNCLCADMKDVAHDLHCSEDTVARALKQLIEMRVICKKAGSRDRSLYELSDKILNPRLAFRGNTKKLNKETMPLLLAPESDKPLIKTINNISNPEFEM